jgi:hypothetical protein
MMRPTEPAVSTMRDSSSRPWCRLPRAIVPFEAEDIESIACRLAWANGFPCANDMLPVYELVVGKSLKAMSQSMFSKLASLSEISEQELTRFWVRPGVIIPFGESLVKRKQINAKVVRYCPLCLIADRKSENVRRGGKQHIRGYWNWSMIDGCHIHGVALSSTAREPGSLPSFDRLLDRTYPEEAREPDEADIYFTRRLTKPRGSTFLDGMHAYIAAELCCVLGEFHRTLKSEDRSRPLGGMFRSSDLRREGYAVAKHGSDAINELLSDHIRKMSTRFDQPRIFYSPARRWWNQNLHNTDYHPIMRLIQNHAEENTPLDRGDIFFWPVLRRKIHTVDTASSEYKLSVDRVRKILSSSMSEEIPRFFRKTDVHRLLMDSRAWLGSEQVAKLLGCSEHVALEIMMSELVTALEDRDVSRGKLVSAEHASGDRDIAHGGRGVAIVVHRDEVERLVADIGAVVSFEPGKKTWSPIEVLKPYGGAVGMLRLLRDGHLTNFYCGSPEIRLENIYVANNDLARIPSDWLTSWKTEIDNELLDLKSARQRINATGSFIEALIAKGLVGHVVRENSVRKNGRTHKLVKRSDLDRFVRDHVSLGELAVDRGIQSALLLAELGRRDIFPVVQGDRFVERHYRRTDIPDVI